MAAVAAANGFAALELHIAVAVAAGIGHSTRVNVHGGRIGGLGLLGLVAGHDGRVAQDFWQVVGGLCGSRELSGLTWRGFDGEDGVVGESGGCESCENCERREDCGSSLDPSAAIFHLSITSVPHFDKCMLEQRNM